MPPTITNSSVVLLLVLSLLSLSTPFTTTFTATFTPRRPLSLSPSLTSRPLASYPSYSPPPSSRLSLSLSSVREYVPLIVSTLVIADIATGQKFLKTITKAIGISNPAEESPGPSQEGLDGQPTPGARDESGVRQYRKLPKDRRAPLIDLDAKEARVLAQLASHERLAEIVEEKAGGEKGRLGREIERAMEEMDE